jgi:NAD(P)-dependent dehydrogenase (short-subunit alcohol dehydrogenase family)
VLLDGKRAVIYGGGGAVGGVVARAFAREGATVYLTGRTLDSLERVAEQIRAAGGLAETALVDALDEAAVDEHADAMAASSGGIDISFNVISTGDVHETPLAQMSLEDFERPVVNRVRTQFLTSKAAARHMIKQGSGVILTFGGIGRRGPIRDYHTGGHQIFMGGTQVAFAAVDALRNQLATELGPHGIRVVTLQSAGVPETIQGEWQAIMTEGLAGLTMLKRPETLDDVGNAAVFAASDLARNLTATALNITGGNVAD